MQHPPPPTTTTMDLDVHLLQVQKSGRTVQVCTLVMYMHNLPTVLETLICCCLSSHPVPPTASPPVSSSNKLSFRTYTCPQKRSTNLEVCLRKRTTTLCTRACGNLMVARVHCTIALMVGKGLRVHAYRAIAMYVTIQHSFCRNLLTHPG